MDLLKAAHAYIKAGICVIATNKDKRAFMAWKQYQERIITIDEINEQFKRPEATNVAIICGKTSGNLEVIDVDCKYDETGSLFEDYLQLITESNEKLAQRLMIIKTRSNGYHIYYRCDTIAGNMKLANRPTTDPKVKQVVLIETRGEAGYVIAPPSEGYKKISGNEIPKITAEERDLLLELARSFNQVIEQPQHHPTSSGYNPKDYGQSPFDDYNKRGDVIGLLRTHGWTVIRDNADKVVLRRPGKTEGTSGDFLKSKMWFSVFTTSSEFEPNKAYLPYAVYAILECRGDFKAAAKKLLDEGYGKRREYYGDKTEKDLLKRKINGASNEELVTHLIQNEKKSLGEAQKMIESLTNVWGDRICTFWDVDEKGKLNINRNKLLDFLHYQGGFSLYYYDRASTIYRVVRSVDGFVEEATTEHIKKFLFGYIDSLPESFDGGITADDLKELILKGSDAYFSKGLLEFLNRSKFDFLKDTVDAAFFPFKNGIVKVDKEGMAMVSYADVDKVIWKSQVIDFDILIDPSLDFFDLVEYVKFIECICNNERQRIEYALSLIGYLLHKYKDPTRPFAVILAEETENENDGGGTGKGIFVKAISKLVNSERIDGKNFKLDKNFAFQRVGLDTKLVSIEDIRKNIDFEGFYSIITEGITVEKKNKDELFIPYEDSPKILFTTNYTIPNTGNHAKRRQKVLEFSNFFNPKRTPEDYFGHKIFNDWDRDEWNRFYNLMFMCVQLYFEQGIMEVKNSDSIKRKQIKLNFSEEYLEWWDNYTKEEKPDQWRGISDLHLEFCRENDISEKDYSIKRFKSAFKKSAEIFSYKIEERRNKQAANRKETRLCKLD